jgi:FkbM family methyltransferase
MKTCLIIGGCDGSDAINYNLYDNVVIVEPIPHLYQRIVNRFPNKKFTIVNSVISNTKGKTKMKTIKKESLSKLPGWCIGISSITDMNAISPKYWDSDRGQIAKKRYNITYEELQKHIIEIEVDAITFSDLVSDYVKGTIEYLQIDTEGFDFEILKMIDFDNIDITKIKYEYSSLSPSDLVKSKQLLTDNGFSHREINTQDIVADKI